MKEDLLCLRQWFDAHYMVMSDKSKAMVFNISNPSQVEKNDLYAHSNLCLYNGKLGAVVNKYCLESCVKIDYVNNLKYLGITIDNRLTFKNHIEILQNQLIISNRSLYTLRPFCYFSTLRILYLALVQSRLSYGITVWVGIYFKNIKPIVTAQKYIMRTLYGVSRYQSCKPLFKKSKILSIRNLYVYRVLKLFYLRSGNRNIKQAKYLFRGNLCFVPASKKEFFRRYYIHSAPSMFNQLPKNIRCLTIINEFLKSLKVWLLELSDVEVLFDIVK